MKYILALLLVYSSSAATLPAQEKLLTLTFEESLDSGDGWVPIVDGYGSLQWNNFGVMDGTVRPVREGYRTGIISPENVAFNLYGDAASISGTTPFDLRSGYLTAAFVDGLQIGVQGWSGSTLAYSDTFTLSTTGPLRIDFNYASIDTARFIPSVHSGFFVMDELVIAVPEPSMYGFWAAGCGLGVLGLIRKRAEGGGTS